MIRLMVLASLRELMEVLPTSFMKRNWLLLPLDYAGNQLHEHTRRPSMVTQLFGFLSSMGFSYGSKQLSIGGNCGF